jgi:hypothetical protein
VGRFDVVTKGNGLDIKEITMATISTNVGEIYTISTLSYVKNYL